ncbi:hypothetical protein [Longimicrobium sp.]|uniref:hypothetical protein n=1 Tax=Longimicrobium sp. TaxID=2029185 RepID=UPI002E2FC158|nr:hypothetical protein [Longimicrobium sp.]HEX6039370.1 hypothetical protein [Longimicrobium sp.]
MVKAHLLVDSFTGTVVDATKWVAFGPVQQAGSVIVTPAASTAFSYGGYVSARRYDLTGSEVRVELQQVLNPAAGARTYLAVKLNNQNGLSLVVENGALLAVQLVANVTTVLASVTYCPTLHRWLRLRESTGVAYWEASPDGKTWTVLAARPSPLRLDDVLIEIGAGTDVAAASPGQAVFDRVNLPAGIPARRIEERRLGALGIREQVAALDADRPHALHASNDDEVNYPAIGLIGSYSKGLRHDALGDPEPHAYASLLRALESGDPGDFEEIILGPGGKKLTNPQAGLAFHLEAPDPQEFTVPPAPRFDSRVEAHEMGELYWMAVARDVHFASYGTDPVIAQAVASLNNEFPAFGGTVPVTTQNVFRGIYPGEQVGPYVSQFLWKGNADPRKPDGQGRDADEGYITYGSQVIDQRQLTVQPGVDYLTSFAPWLNAQNGADFRGQDQFDTQRRFIRNLRDGTSYVHFDQVINAFYNAATILLAEPTGNQLNGVGAGRPMVDMEFPFGNGNPYDSPGTVRDSRTQAGFVTFGPVHLLELLNEGVARALRATWFQKWFVHRRLRPEEFGGRIDNWLNARRDYPIHVSIRNSLQGGGLAPYYGQAGERFPSYLLPQAFPEGAPTHPAYAAGHATGAGAAVTLLKAFFDGNTPIENPLIPNAAGTALVPYTGADAGQMTVTGELNKLAGNIALFRNAAGVHWRSDYTYSLLLGEAVPSRCCRS